VADKPNEQSDRGVTTIEEAATHSGSGSRSSSLVAQLNQSCSSPAQQSFFSVHMSGLLGILGQSQWGNLLRFLCALNLWTAHLFADVAGELKMREREKHGNDFLLRKRRRLWYRCAWKRVAPHWGETAQFPAMASGSRTPLRPSLPARARPPFPARSPFASRASFPRRPKLSRHRTLSRALHAAILCWPQTLAISPQLEIQSICPQSIPSLCGDESTTAAFVKFQERKGKASHGCFHRRPCPMCFCRPN
jgi:hypothetical protein